MKSQLILFRSTVLWFLLITTMPWVSVLSQSGPDMTEDAYLVKSIFESALRDGQCYNWLTDLVGQAGHRLSGSAGAAVAVNYTRTVLDTLGLDSVWLLPCKVPRWVRGEKEIVRIASPSMPSYALRALALGNSVGSGKAGVSGQVIEVLSIDELKAMRPEDVAGKIVFFNRPMDETLVNTFHAYGRAVDQRWAGPRVAAEKGAVAAVVRSMTVAHDTIPHTGSTDYRPDGPNIPAVAISTVDADYLDELLKSEPVDMYIRTTCSMQDSVISYSVIGQINGSKRSEEIILVGGHLDSWDVGHGAHDDGAGCVQAMDVLYLLRKTGYVPRRTIRCVLFMNEENGLSGGKSYAAFSNTHDEFHLAAIESDAGGFRPLGFGLSAEGSLQEKYLTSVAQWWGLLEPYHLSLSAGGGGADIGPLKSQGGMLIGLKPVTQRYFDYHHTAADTIDKVHPRELRLGAGAVAALVVLIDKYGQRYEP